MCLKPRDVKKKNLFKEETRFFLAILRIAFTIFKQMLSRGLSALKTVIFKCIETVDLYKACLGFCLLKIRLLKIKSLMSRILSKRLDRSNKNFLP